MYLEFNSFKAFFFIPINFKYILNEEKKFSFY